MNNDTGDVPPQREHELAQRIEHRDEQAEQAADAARGNTTDDLLAELINDLDTHGPDPYPGDDPPYWEISHARDDEALQHRPGDIDRAADLERTTEDERPRERAQGGDPDDPAGWQAAVRTPVPCVTAGPDPWQPPPAASARVSRADHDQLTSEGEHDDGREPSAERQRYPGASSAQRAGSGADPMERARRAIENLDMSHAQQAQAGQLSRWRADQDARTTGFSAEGLSPRERGW